MMYPETWPTGIYPSELYEGKWDAVYQFPGGGGSVKKVVEDNPQGLEFIQDHERATVKHWEQVIATSKNDPTKLVIDHYYYGLGKEPRDPTMDKSLRGFGGRRFQIERLGTGEKIVTHNLWSGGRIPEEYWDRLPDNARFVNGEHWVDVGGIWCMASGPKE